MSQSLGKEKSSLEKITNQFSSLDSSISDLEELFEMISNDNDDSIQEQISNELDSIQEELSNLQFNRMFSGETDENNAFLDIQSGSGGTEAQDWAEMLLRMYLMWGERKKFKTEIIEVSPGEVAGVKSATIKFEGDFCFGWLRTETGVHRLVRKSPFDSGSRRHTSFASIFVSPEIDDNIDIELNSADIRIDTYRASGAGGQHVNKTESAIRITHIPSGLVVTCQDESSQHKNRASALKVLRSRLLADQKEKAAAERAAERKSLVSTGDRSVKIRTYNFPQGRVTDHRINFTSYRLTEIMNGDIEEIIEELKIAEQQDILSTDI